VVPTKNLYLNTANTGAARLTLRTTVRRVNFRGCGGTGRTARSQKACDGCDIVEVQVLIPTKVLKASDIKSAIAF